MSEKILSRSLTSKLALGTVQFGLNYGVANRTGQVSLDAARNILERAYRQSVDTLDTAIAYGDSEHRLGDLGVESWRVISKLAPFPKDQSNAEAWVRDGVAGSLHRLRKRHLDGLLLHRAQDLIDSNGDKIYAALCAVKRDGLVRKIGVSLYDPEDLEELTRRFRLDLVQAPFNIVDRRLETSGWLRRLNKQGVEVHVRSAFLQGLLLMAAKDRPARFTPFNALWHAWEDWLRETQLTPLEACLAFALSKPEVSRVVIGVDNDEQLSEILASARERTIQPPDTLLSSDPALINPLSWITS